MGPCHKRANFDRTHEAELFLGATWAHFCARLCGEASSVRRCWRMFSRFRLPPQDPDCLKVFTCDVPLFVSIFEPGCETLRRHEPKSSDSVLGRSPGCAGSTAWQVRLLRLRLRHPPPLPLTPPGVRSALSMLWGQSSGERATSWRSVRIRAAATHFGFGFGGFGGADSTASGATRAAPLRGDGMAASSDLG